MSTFPDAPPTNRGQKTVTAVIRCVVCGYELRGLLTTGACPECGTPVEHSLRGNLLQHSSPAYVALLHRGAFLAELSVVLLILGTIGMVLVAALLGTSATGAGTGVTPGAVEIASQGLSLITAMISLIGWWLVSTPDPSLATTLPGGASRKVLRIGVTVRAAAILGSLIVVSFTLTAPLPGPALAGVVGVLALVATAAWVVSYFAAMVYIRAIASRVPDTRLEKSAKSLQTLGIVVLVGILLFYAALFAMIGAMAAGGGPITTMWFGLMIPGAVLGLTCLYALIRYIGLLDRLRSALKEQRQLAEINIIASTARRPVTSV